MSKRILIIEDEKPIINIIRRKFRRYGINAIFVQTIDQAVSYLKKFHNISGIWLDQYLLKSTMGLNIVVQTISKESPIKKIPIFLVSCSASPDTIQSYLKSGVCKFFTKADLRLDNIISDINMYILKK